MRARNFSRRENQAYADEAGSSLENQTAEQGARANVGTVTSHAAHEPRHSRRGSSLTLGGQSRIRPTTNMSLAACFDHVAPGPTLLPRSEGVPASRSTCGGKLKSPSNRQVMNRIVGFLAFGSGSALGAGRRSIRRKPNKAPEPTPGLVMPRAGARVTPSPGVAHL